MVYQIAASVLKGHSSIASFLYCICALVDKIMTDKGHRTVPVQ